jgi:hypothetical protein
MCKSTKGTQAAAGAGVRGVKPNQGSGGNNPAPPTPPNAFGGRPERVPQISFIRERAGDGFLDSAKDYYTRFGINVQLVDSVAEIVTALSTANQVFKCIGIVSHAHPRGMLIPFFTNGVKGTNKDIFREFAKSDLDGLKLLCPFESGINHLFNWESKMAQLLTLIRSTNAASLQPFGLQTNGILEGDLREYVKYCFDIVYLRNPGRVLRNPSNTDGLSAGQRNILENFVKEILNQIRPKIMAAKSVTTPQVDAVMNVVLGYSYNQVITATGIGDFHPHLGLDNDNMNDFPTLSAATTAVHNGFHEKLVTARTHINASTFIDIRGCRAGQDEDYLEAIREFFGTGEQKPTVSAPRWFQGYPKIGFKTLNTQAQVKSALNHASEWGYTPTQRKATFTTWAELIKVKPLHFDFWLSLLKGKATTFASLSWREQIPPLFIATPGVAALNGKDFGQVVGSLKDFFAVPTTSIISPSAITALQPITSNLPTWNPQLTTPLAADATSPQRTTIFQNLQTINSALAQSFVPATSPNAPEPPTAGQLQGFQTTLLNFLENTKLTAVKTFMTAAAESLETGDGIHFYMLFAGLPVFVNGIPELGKNGLFVLDAHKVAAFQEWYKCLWKDPLPASGAYKTATIGTLSNRQVAALVGEDRTSLLSICPIPKYMSCIRTRPLQPGDDESLCS